MQSVPGYWMNEASGVLRPVVTRYLNGERLDDADIPVMRAYLRQWINAMPVATVELRAGVDAIVTHEDVRSWLSAALDQGIDPI